MFRVLIIEDDKVTRRILCNAISGRGHDVKGVDTAEEALELMKQSPVQWLIVDVNLPGMSGLEFCRRVRSMPQGEYFYILVGTVEGRPEDLHAILNAGANDYIAKPYSPSLLGVRLTIAEEQVRQLGARRQAEERLLFLATHDPLTGLSNRNGLEAHLKDILQQSRNGQPGCVLYLDLDNFKAVNDTLGHGAGDRLLTQVADILRDIVRKEDAVIRFGGDEFILILRNADSNTAGLVAQRAIDTLGGMLFTQGGHSFRIGASIGIAEARIARDTEHLLSLADAACYAAKSRGKNRIEVYNSDTREIQSLVSDSDWVTRIRTGAAERQLQLWYQPVINSFKGDIVFQEGLLRYIPPGVDEPVAAVEFLPAMLRQKQVAWLDNFVLTQACETLEKYPQMRLSINVSTSLFTDTNAKVRLMKQLERLGENARRLILEITETEIFLDLKTAGEFMHVLKKSGCLLALDDFGKSVSTFSQLRSLPIDFVKIDGSIIQQIIREPFYRTLAQSILELSIHQGCQVVAECVENEQIRATAAEMGIHCLQGHAIAWPTMEPLAAMPASPTSP